MFSRLRRFFGGMRGSSLLRADHAQESKQPVENTDAMAAGMMRHTDPTGGVGASFPPGYVPPADEGRPRH